MRPPITLPAHLPAACARRPGLPTGRAHLTEEATQSRRVASMADFLARRALYDRTRLALADLDDDQFAAAIGDRPPDARRGWGDSYRAELCGFPVFVKRLPLTAQEQQRADDTSNIFGLPDFYHYGVGRPASAPPGRSPLTSRPPPGSSTGRSRRSRCSTTAGSCRDLSLRRTRASTWRTTSGDGTATRRSAG